MKNFLLPIFAILPIVALAEILLVEKSNGDVIELPAENIQEMQFKASNAEYPDNTPECVEIVDLGLSVNWASVNLGATIPEEPGYLVSWGELEEKDWYSWSYYKHGTSKSSITKYNIVDGLSILQLEDDAAAMLWGGNWRMPSRENWQELYDNCEVDFAATENGYPGVRFTSKIPGYEDKSIFLCAAGWIQDEYHMSDVALATYWANECVISPSISMPEFAFAAEFWREGDYANQYYYSGVYRYQGRPIRAVTAEKSVSDGSDVSVSIVVELIDGTTQKYVSDNQPVLTFEEETVCINTELIETRYKMQNIVKFYFEKEDVRVESVKENQMAFYFDGRNIVINGKSCSVIICDTTGKIYHNAYTDEGFNSIDISDYNAGIYIVNANNQSIKILKK